MSKQQAYADFHAARPSKNLAPTLIVAVLLAAAAAISFLPDEAGAKIAVGLFAVFAIAGICGLFLVAAGFCQFSPQLRKSSTSKETCDGSSDGLIVTGPGGKILYANEAYLTLSRTSGLSDARPVERLFARSPEVAEAIYRLTQTAREG